MTDTTIRVQVDEKLTEEASVVSETIGMTVPHAFRMMIARIAREKRLPFEALIRNADTIEAMTAARNGQLIDAGTAKELLTLLHAED